MANLIRTFIAVELDEATRNAIGDVQAQWQGERVGRAVRWVAPDNIHITLKFLGDVAADRMSELQSTVVNACASIPAFTLKISGAGAFPNTRRPNNVWIGVDGDVKVLERLANQIEEACAAIGYAREDRPFTAHLTLGRVQRDASPSDRRALGEMIERTRVGELSVLRVASVNVMKSELRPGGSVYSQLASVNLQLTNGK
jgi:RNA 2',3'-cyclic 3'-phosphodiesterase